jgi:transcriptional regulator with XRE-family HTH domain
LTRTDFVERIGPSHSYLYAVEHGRNEVKAEALLAISGEFGKSLEWLVTGED